MLHDHQRIVSTDKYFVYGTNPDGQGGGVIASFNNLEQAQSFVAIAIKEDYTEVRVRTWDELFAGV